VKCSQCKDHRFVCEVHRWRPFPHDDCAGPSLPCSECQSPSAKPELPDGWESYASTGDDDPFDQRHWPPFAPKPQPTRETLFTFERPGRTIMCELRYSEYGVEAVFLEDGFLFYSHLFATKTLAVCGRRRESCGRTRCGHLNPMTLRLVSFLHSAASAPSVLVAVPGYACDPQVVRLRLGRSDRRGHEAPPRRRDGTSTR
jgi:hypothetical protein